MFHQKILIGLKVIDQYKFPEKKCMGKTLIPVTNSVDSENIAPFKIRQPVYFHLTFSLIIFMYFWWP